jgi:hypothetical protein
MAQAVLTFNLPEEQSEFNDAVHASDYKMVLWDMKQELRRYWKYSEDEHEIKLATKLNEHFIDLLNNYGVSLD